MLAKLPKTKRERILESLSQEEVAQLQYHWDFWARPNQRTPLVAFFCWLVLAGRGYGKTRVGSEWTIRAIESGQCKRFALIGETAADVRDVMVEGDSGILACSPPWFRPVYEPSKRRLTWPNGAIATTYSADKPDQLRGPQHDGAWADEIAKWRYVDAWDQLIFGLRLGKNPQVVATTTPRPTPLIKTLSKESDTHVTRGSTFENSANLSEKFLQKLRDKYENTRLGRQEIYAEILDDNPGALWSRALLEKNRVQKAPELRRIVVAVDPAVTSNEDSDETGIVVCGLGFDGHGYVLEDASGIYTPNEWATKVVEVYETWKADRVVAEVNNGGDLVENTIRTIPNDRGRRVSYKGVRASRGKATRAEPVAALDEQGKIHHVGFLSGLEDQMTDWNPSVDKDSPDRVDARVWGFSELMLKPRARAQEKIGSSTGGRGW